MKMIRKTRGQVIGRAGYDGTKAEMQNGARDGRRAADGHGFGNKRR
jgi:hypothetical protein